MEVYSNFIIRRLRDIERSVNYKNSKRRTSHVIEISIQKRLIKKASESQLEQHSDYVIELMNIIRNNKLFKRSITYTLNEKCSMRNIILVIKSYTKKKDLNKLSYNIDIRDIDFGFEYISKNDDWYESSEII